MTPGQKFVEIYDWVTGIKGDNNFILGTCCQLRLAEKRIVNYTDLKPDNNAKAWPIPYRFSKNSTMPPPKLELPHDNMKYNNRRLHDKKRSKSSSGSGHSTTSSLAIELGNANVDAYKDYPLQMQHCDDHVCEGLTHKNTQADNQSTYHGAMVQSDELWEEAPPTTSAPVVWHLSPQPMQNIVTYVLKTMLSTPPAMNYPDPLLFYNYKVWTNPSDAMSRTGSSVEGQSPRVEIPPSPESHPFPHFPDNMFTSPPPKTPMDRSMCMTPSTPLSPQMEMYQPFFSVPPPTITPIIYSSPQMIVPNSPHILVYSPTIDMSFLSPPPFIYPPTPPAAWHMNAQNGPNII